MVIILSSPSRKEIIENIHNLKVGDENGVFSAQISNDGSKAAIGLGSGSIQVLFSWQLPLFLLIIL